MYTGLIQFGSGVLHEMIREASSLNEDTVPPALVLRLALLAVCSCKNCNIQRHLAKNCLKCTLSFAVMRGVKIRQC